MIQQEKYPILEFDTEKERLIRPKGNGENPPLPSKCLMTFFGDVIIKLCQENKIKEIGEIRSENGRLPIYEICEDDKKVTLVHAHMGAPMAVRMLEELIEKGVKKVVAVGGCGVLEEFNKGFVLIPYAAVRDDGTYYHYMAPSREMLLDKSMVSHLEKTAEKEGYLYKTVKTWTTDGFFRETKDKVALRKKEGCSTVEMECSALAALAFYRDISFGQYLMSGDILRKDSYDDRGWIEDQKSREKLFWLGLSALLKC